MRKIICYQIFFFVFLRRGFKHFFHEDLVYLNYAAWSKTEGTCFEMMRVIKEALDGVWKLTLGKSVGQHLAPDPSG